MGTITTFDMTRGAATSILEHIAPGYWIRIDNRAPNLSDLCITVPESMPLSEVMDRLRDNEMVGEVRPCIEPSWSMQRPGKRVVTVTLGGGMFWVEQTARQLWGSRRTWLAMPHVFPLVRYEPGSDPVHVLS